MPCDGSSTEIVPATGATNESIFRSLDRYLSLMLKSIL